MFYKEYLELQMLKKTKELTLTCFIDIYCSSKQDMSELRSWWYLYNTSLHQSLPPIQHSEPQLFQSELTGFNKESPVVFAIEFSYKFRIQIFSLEHYYHL